jgi:hypothetical protein
MKPTTTETMTDTIVFQLNLAINHFGSCHASTAAKMIPKMLQINAVIRAGSPELESKPLSATNKKNPLAITKRMSRMMVITLEMMDGVLVGMIFLK